MKKYAGLLLVSMLGGALTLSAYLAFFGKNQYVIQPSPVSVRSIPVNYGIKTPEGGEATDFTIAAEKTVHTVVHVKNLSVSREPSSLFDFFHGYGGRERAQVGTGSGIIISPDGYIVTNNHVVEDASELQVTLNDNKTYKAELIGSDASTDIALLKIKAAETLLYLPFGNSDNTKIGEWVLAVGNPFNLTSTVTAGIISAKSRDLSENDGRNQSFIQTDAAVNPGNSGGALVNTRGELIGINTAITSQTGSYIGYSFAVPSNIARKVVEDIMEYGNVQRGMLGVSGMSLNSYAAEQLGVKDTEGFYVDAVEEESGAEKAGLKKGDIVKKIDNVTVSKFSDLTGYINSKRPNDVVNVTILREGKTKTLPVKLVKVQTYEINQLGIEVKNLSKGDMSTYRVKNGVKITRTNEYMKRYNLEGKVLVAINDKSVSNIDDVKQVMNNSQPYDQTVLVMINQRGEKERFVLQ